jgi:hypothetical protein
MKLEDLTGDDRTLVVVALQALFGSELTHIRQPAPPASLQARNHQLRIFLAWRQVFRQFAGWELSRRDETRYEINQ